MPALTLANLMLYAAQAALVIGALAAAARRAAAVAGLPPGRLPGRARWRSCSCRGWRCCGRRRPRCRPCRSAPAPGQLRRGDRRARRAGPARGAAIAGGVLAAGIALRLLWLGVGLLRLSRLTRRLPDGRDDRARSTALQAELGTRARVALRRPASRSP